MPLRDDVAALLAEFARQGAVPYDEIGVLRARRGVENAAALQGERVPVASVRDVLVDGGDGRVPARIYAPGDRRDGEDPRASRVGARRPGDHARPLIVCFHGGGWVIGSVALADRPCRALAAATGAVVVSVEYRRAPETPFPGPLEDCWAATTWCAAHAEELGADPSRVVVLGDSAGGNLAAAIALLARDRGGPTLAGQVLIYPVVDHGVEHPSLAENATGYSLHRSEVEWYWSLYHPGPGASPRAAPLREPDLSGLPPALVVTAQYDPLRDEGDAYAAALTAAGVDTTAVSFPGVIHGFLWFGGRLAATAPLLGLVAAWVGADALVRAFPGQDTATHARARSANPG